MKTYVKAYNCVWYDMKFLAGKALSVGNAPTCAWFLMSKQERREKVSTLPRVL